MLKNETAEEFLARGGTITLVDSGKSSLNKTGRPKKFHQMMLNAARNGSRQAHANKAGVND